MAETTRRQNGAQNRGAVVAASDQYSRLTAGEAAVEAFKDYARERPEIVTMWAFGLGFVLGWKLRIW